MGVNFFSHDNADEVRRAINEARNDELDDFFDLTIVGLGDGHATEEVTTVRLREARDPQFLQNGYTLVYCKDRYGNKIDVYLPPEGQIPTPPAEVLIDETDIPGS